MADPRALLDNKDRRQARRAASAGQASDLKVGALPHGPLKYVLATRMLDGGNLGCMGRGDDHPRGRLAMGVMSALRAPTWRFTSISWLLPVAGSSFGCIGFDSSFQQTGLSGLRERTHERV